MEMCLQVCTVTLDTGNLQRCYLRLYEQSLKRSVFTKALVGYRIIGSKIPCALKDSFTESRSASA